MASDRVMSIAEKIVREGRVARQIDGRSELFDQQENYLQDRIRALMRRVQELENENLHLKGANN